MQYFVSAVPLKGMVIMVSVGYCPCVQLEGLSSDRPATATLASQKVNRLTAHNKQLQPDRHLPHCHAYNRIYRFQHLTVVNPLGFGRANALLLA